MDPYRFLRRVIGSRQMILALTRQAVRSRYADTAGGLAWTVIQPLATIATYWFVFTVGFRAQTTSGEPFILFFVVGLAPWLFFNDAVTSATGAVQASPHLVKRMVFPTELLPLVQVMAAAISHGVILTITLAVIVMHGVGIGPDALALVYYFCCIAVLALGFGWAAAALQVFFRDLGQMVTVLFGFWFWLTPVVWSPVMLPPDYRGWLPYNPVNYVVQGYRDSLIYGVAPIERWGDGLIFWVETVTVVALGATVFRRLKPEFAEVI